LAILAIFFRGIVDVSIISKVVIVVIVVNVVNAVAYVHVKYIYII